MRFPKIPSLTLRNLGVFFLVYVVLLTLLLVWASQLLQMVSRDDPVFLPLLIILSLIFPFLLLLITIWNIIKAWNQRRAGEPGSRLRLRLIFSFFLIVLITAVPQGLLAAFFLKTAMGQWLAPQMREALEGGERIALTTYQGALEHLEALSKSQALDNLLSRAYEPEELWKELGDIHPELKGLQYISPGVEAYYGDRRTWLFEEERKRFPNEGALPQRSAGNATILSWQILRGDIKLILASILPENFVRDASNLTMALDAWREYDRLESSINISLILFWLFLSGPLIFLAFCAGMILSDRVIRPLVQLGEATRKIAEGDFSFRILGRVDEEISFLTSSFNQMIGELEVSRIKILQTEKVVAWQEIAQRLAHELRNPLTPIKLSTQRLLRKINRVPLDPQWAKDVLLLILREVDELDSLLHDFRDFAGGAVLRKESVHIRQLLLEALERFRAIQPGIKWTLHPGIEDPLVSVDPRQIRQVLVNLLKNASEAGARVVSLRLDIIRKGAIPYARFQVRDDGEGIPLHRVEKVFQPYDTTKTSGSGLGLAVVQRIIYDHRGRIWFESEVAKGTVFYIDLPMEGSHEPYFGH